MEWMSHRKQRETKQQPSMLPGPAVPGCCLVSFRFLCDIHSIHSLHEISPAWIVRFTSGIELETFLCILQMLVQNPHWLRYSCEETYRASLLACQRQRACRCRGLSGYGSSWPGLEKERQESKILLPCWAVLTSLPVFLSSLWASPLLLFSAQILAWKRETRSAGLL